MMLPREDALLSADAEPNGSSPAVRCLGREQELADLVELAEATVRDGHGRVVVLEGEPGIGKSRLVAAFASELSGRGLTVFAGRCRDGVHHAATYRPLIEILEQAVRGLDDAAEQAVAERGREVLHALEGRHVPGAGGNAWAERRAALFDAVSGFLIDCSRLLRVAILVHDLDAADGATRDLVVHVATAGAPAAALASGSIADRLRGALIVTARELDMAPLSGAATTRVRLRPLDVDGVRAFLQSPEVVSFFAEATGGRPRALEALLENIPVNADELFRARWDRLAAAGQRAAGALAVAGRTTGLGELGELAQLDGESLAQAAQALARQRVVRREVIAGEVMLSLFRRGDEEAIYALLSDETRAELHLRAGRHLAANGRDELLDRVRVAEHLLRGGAGAPAVDAALRAADALELTYGYDRAIDLLRRARTSALGLTIDADGRNGQTVVDIDARLYELERAVGDYDAALASARRMEDHAPDAASRRRVASLHLLRDEIDPALEALEAADALAGDDRAEHARILAARAEALYLAGRTAEASRAAEDALAQEGEHDADAAARRVEVQNTLGKIALAEARYADAAAAFTANLAPARALGSAFEESRAMFNLGIAELRLGDHAQAQRRYVAALQIAESAGDHRNRAFCLQNLGVLSHWRGDYEQALSHFRGSVAAFRRTGQRARLAWVALDLASVYLDLHDRDAAAATAALVTQLDGVPPEIGVDHELVSARIAALGGEVGEARQRAQRARRSASGRQHERAIEAAQLLARLDLDEGKLDDAAHALDGLPVSRAERTQLRTDLLRGELQVARGRGLEARRLLRDALATAQRLADLESEWRAQYWLGRAAQSLRDDAEAERRLRAALATDHRLRARVPESQRAVFEATPLRRALEDALGISPPVLKETVALAAVSTTRVVEEISDAALPGRLLGRHPKMRQVGSLVARAAPADTIVLIRGESGTGKELIAEALHEGSRRRDRPFVKVNCGAIVESLLLSELFGHERGAFTGALQRKKGRFEVAHGGTLFLDEIGDISPGTQVALLRVLQEQQFERVGGTTPVRVDVRILCATHRRLEEMVARGEFREDLYYRLRGIQIDLPPLRERGDDVLIIARSILARLAQQRGVAIWRLTADAEALLVQHAWPGNVRELENVLRSATLFADGAEISAVDLAEFVASQREVRAASPVPQANFAVTPSSDAAGDDLWLRLQREGLSLKALKTRVEIECIERALAQSGGNITRAAVSLGMKRPRLSQLIKEHGLRGGAIDDVDDGAGSMEEEVL
jgi:DNA-binding NtrC family response regulator